MANVKMGDFLLQYYMQRRFNTMPATVRAQFDVYAKSDDFRGNMKDWKKKLMHADADGTWHENTMPDSAPPPPHPDDLTGNMTMTDDEWEKLFKAFQNAFRKMSANADSFKDNAKATSFLREYFGHPATHLFANAVADPLTAEPLIQGAFKRFLEQNKNSLKIYCKQWGLVDDKFSFSDLMSGIKSRKYNTDPAFQDKVKTIAQYINFYGNQSDFRESLGMAPGERIPDFSNVEKGFDSGNIPDDKLDYFKRNYKDLLNTLAGESKVYDVFKEYDNGKISKHLDAANGKVDYANKDSKDYVPPKRADELTAWQQLKENVSDTWSDYMDKYIKLRGDRLYYSHSAKLIVKALTGAKFKPTDGLDKLLDSAGDIKKNLMYKSPRAVDHFEWMTKTLGELKDTMPKAFAGALKNGGQMRALVSELIINAVRENKIDEAKTMMEVLSVVKYGYTTSKIMDTLRADKELFTIFSDKDLSWNKDGNMGVRIVTTAMDKTIRFAFLAAGYAVTGIGNAIRLNGSKFNGKTGRMKKSHDAWVAQNAAARADAVAHRNTENAIDMTKKAPYESTLSALAAAGIDADNIDDKKTELETAKKAAEDAKEKYDRTEKRYNDAADIINQDQQLSDNSTALRNDIKKLDAEIKKREVALASGATFAALPPATASAMANQLMQEKISLENEKQEKEQQRTQIVQQRVDLRPRASAARRAEPARKSARDTAKSAYDTAQAYVDDLGAKIEDFENATARIKEYDEHIKKRDDMIANWDKEHQDKYQELMAHWDLLETGRDSHTGPMYSWALGKAKKKQDKFDKNKNVIFATYSNKYSMAA